MVSDGSRPLVSIVVPVLRDTAALAGLLRALRAERLGGRVEVVVANGDGADRSLDPLRRRAAPVLWVDGEPGRGRQMNAGARASSGRWLLFLHADARPGPGWLSALAEADERPEVAGGAFRLALASRHWAARVIERGVAARTRWLRLPYGDQAIFVRREAFDALGGYRPLALMEDVDFVGRLRRRGRLWFPPVPVRVSARRWERDGWLRRTALNLALLGLYAAGVEPGRLARWYYHGGRPPAPARRAAVPSSQGGAAPAAGAAHALDQDVATARQRAAARAPAAGAAHAPDQSARGR